MQARYCAIDFQEDYSPMAIILISSRQYERQRYLYFSSFSILPAVLHSMNSGGEDPRPIDIESVWCFQESKCHSFLLFLLLSAGESLSKRDWHLNSEFTTLSNRKSKQRPEQRSLTCELWIAKLKILHSPIPRENDWDEENSVVNESRNSVCITSAKSPELAIKGVYLSWTVLKLVRIWWKQIWAHESATLPRETRELSRSLWYPTF